MKLFLRFLFSVMLLGLAGFSVFGFLATFEPDPALCQWGWRVAYALVGAASAWTCLRLWRSKRAKDPQANSITPPAA